MAEKVSSLTIRPRPRGVDVYGDGRLLGTVRVVEFGGSGRFEISNASPSPVLFRPWLSSLPMGRAGEHYFPTSTKISILSEFPMRCFVEERKLGRRRYPSLVCRPAVRKVVEKGLVRYYSEEGLLLKEEPLAFPEAVKRKEEEE